MGTLLFATASKAEVSSKSNLPNSLAPSFTKGYISLGGSFMPAITSIMISLAEVKPQSPKMHTTFFGRSYWAHSSTVLAPIEMPVRMIFCSGPKRFTA